MLFDLEPRSRRFGGPMVDGNSAFASNVKLFGTVAGSLLHVRAVPASSLRPMWFPFRHPTATDGGIEWRKTRSPLLWNSAATGATFATTNSKAFRLWVCAFDAGDGRIVLALRNCSTSTLIHSLNPTVVASTTPVSGSATSAGVFYSPSGITLTNKPFCILGYVEYNATGLGTVGTYATAPNFVQLFGPGVKKPGDVVQVVTATTSDDSATTSTSYADTNLTVSITPTSAANACLAWASGNASNSSSADVAYFQLVGSATLSEGIVFGTTFQQSPTSFVGFEKPNTTSSQTYKMQAKSGVGTSTATFAANNLPAVIVVHEVMG